MIARYSRSLGTASSFLALCSWPWKSPRSEESKKSPPPHLRPSPVGFPPIQPLPSLGFPFLVPLLPFFLQWKVIDSTLQRVKGPDWFILMVSSRAIFFSAQQSSMFNKWLLFLILHLHSSSPVLHRFTINCLFNRSHVMPRCSLLPALLDIAFPPS